MKYLYTALKGICRLHKLSETERHKDYFPFSSTSMVRGQRSNDSSVGCWLEVLVIGVPFPGNGKGIVFFRSFKIGSGRAQPHAQWEIGGNEAAT
jgi:hypothetical protein